MCPLHEACYPMHVFIHNGLRTCIKWCITWSYCIELSLCFQMNLSCLDNISFTLRSSLHCVHELKWRYVKHYGPPMLMLLPSAWLLPLCEEFVLRWPPYRWWTFLITVWRLLCVHRQDRLQFLLLISSVIYCLWCVMNSLGSACVAEDF